jgi:hypothetical protein
MLVIKPQTDRQTDSRMQVGMQIQNVPWNTRLDEMEMRWRTEYLDVRKQKSAKLRIILQLRGTKLTYPPAVGDDK